MISAIKNFIFVLLTGVSGLFASSLHAQTISPKTIQFSTTIDTNNLISCLNNTAKELVVAALNHPGARVEKDTVFVLQVDVVQAPIVALGATNGQVTNCAIAFIIYSNEVVYGFTSNYTNYALVTMVCKEDNRLNLSFPFVYDPFENMDFDSYQKGQTISMKPVKISEKANALSLEWTAYSRYEGLDEQSTGINYYVIDNNTIVSVLDVATVLTTLTTDYQYDPPHSNMESYTGTLSRLPASTEGFFNLQYIRTQFVEVNDEMQEHGTDTLFFQWKGKRYEDK